MMNASSSWRRHLTNVLLGLAILIAIVLVLGGLKYAQINTMLAAFAATPEESSTVAPFTVAYQEWPSEYAGVASVQAQEGITLAAEVPGRVKRIAFKSGDWVERGAILIEQETDNETAQLAAASARLQLASTQYARIQELRKSGTVSQAQLDEALQQRDSARAEVANLNATLEKKVVRAPFAGKLGLRQADLGQDLQVGAAIVTLQASDRVRVNLSVPQAWLAQVKNGQPVTVTLATDSTKTISGVVTAVAAEINTKSRSALVQTYVDNSQGWLIPGMAVNMRITLAAPRRVLAVPSTAIIYATFGDTLFVLDKEADKDAYRARQQFVRLGRSYGDFVEVLDGVKEGEQVVSAGAFKLRAGSLVTLGELPQVEHSQNPTPDDN